MLFDPRPKTRREELYDRREELGALEGFAASGSPLMVVLGIRRIGKTSLLKVFLNETGLPYILIDARALEDQGFRRDTLYGLLSTELNRLRSRWKTVIDYIKALEGVEVGAASITFRWREKRLSLTDLFAKLDEWARDTGNTLMVAVDEAQLLRYLRGGKGRIDFTRIISYCYDNLPRLKFIVTGSEIGVLRDFLGFDRPDSWLYGRIRDEITVDRFTRDKSMGFLEEGFKQCGATPPQSLLEEAVDRLDGIPGWLTYFGYRYCRRPEPGVVREIFNEAKAIALNELKKLPSRYYILALKAIALGYRRWKNVKQAVELWTGHTLTNAQITRVLHSLMKLGIVGKMGDEYVILDPVTAEAAKEL